MANSDLIKVMASAEISLVDETDASTLTSNMQVIKGSKNQIYIVGQTNPFSPDWKKSNLVIRPFLQASNVTKQDLSGIEYNPDLFDPKEYPNPLYDGNYIKDIHWFIRDTAGIETEIYDSTDYSFSYTYTIDGKTVVCNDKRQLVIKGNVLGKNSTADLICKYSFYDPFANIYISQQTLVTIVNLASGLSNSKIVTMPINGNSITNTSIQYLDIVAKFYGDSGEESIGDLIDNGDSTVSCLWYIRDKDNWALLDPTQTGQEQANSVTQLYKIMRIKSYDANSGNYEFEDYYGPKGNAVLRLFPDLIVGSEVIKCVFTDSTGAQFSTIEVVYDNTDTTKVEIYSSNGRRLKRNETKGTDLKAIVTYKGNLLEDNSSLYDTEFDYYWYKYTYGTDKMVNVYNNDSNEIVINEDKDNPIKGKRILHASSNDIDINDKQTKIMLDLAEHREIVASMAQASFYSASVSEEDLNLAINLNNNVGIDTNDLDAALFTAKELKAISES